MWKNNHTPSPFHQLILKARFLLTLSPSIPIVHRSGQVLQTASSVCTKLKYVCWSANTGVSMCWSRSENVIYEFVLASTAILSIFCSPLWDGRHVAVQLQFYGELLPGIFKTIPSILVLFSSIFFLNLFLRVHVVLLYSSTDKGTSWKKPHFILSERLWPSTEPSIKRCTCVNKWKNSGSRRTLENNITRCRLVWDCWRQDAEVRTSLQIEGFAALSDPWFSNPSQDEEVLLGLRERTWVNIAVCPGLHSFLTHNKHHPFENKVWEIYIFIRSVFVHYWSRHYRLIMFPHISVYLYMYTCSCIVAIQHYRYQCTTSLYLCWRRFK